MLAGLLTVAASACASAATTATTVPPIVSATTVPPTATTTAPTTTAPPGLSTTTTAATVPATTSTTTPPAAITPLPPDVRALMTGRSWRPGCPVGFDALRLVEVPFVDLTGTSRRGHLVVHEDHADAILTVFEELARARFPIERLELVDEFAADDDASMAANNTSGFNCRRVAGTNRWSEHAYGRAVDINPRFNPWVRGDRIDPPSGAAYADRSRREPGMIQPDDVVVEAFQRIGWEWGGNQQRAKDYQHFSSNDR